ncbi:hypothetical protein Tco_0905865 [Tanacetum coccineum]
MIMDELFLTQNVDRRKIINQTESLPDLYQILPDLIPPKKVKSQTGSKRKSKKKVSISVDDNIIPEPDVQNEVKGSSKAKGDSAIDWGSKEESKYSKEENVDKEIEWLTTDEEEEKKDDDEDDRSIDIEKTDDEETYDEFVHDDEEITNAEKAYAEKAEVTKVDLEQAGKLPLTSSILSVSSGFDTEINSLLDIQIQQEVPHIQSPSILIVLVSVIHEPIVLSPIFEIPLVTPVTILPPPSYVTNITPEKDIQELKQLDQSLKIIATIRSQEIIKIKQEQAVKEKMPKFSATPYDQAAEAEFKQKEIIFKMMRESKSYKKHAKHKALFDTLMLSLIRDEDDLDRVVPYLRKRDREEDEDPFARSNQRKRKKSSRKDSGPSRKSSASKETSKGDTLPKSSKTGKSASTEESAKEATHEMIGSNQVVDDQPEQPGFNDLLSAKKDPLTFDELMGTPIDFSKFAMNRLKINKLTKAHLVGPVYNLLEECYKALSNQLDWNNPKGDRCPFDLSKPLPLKGRPGHLTVASEYFFNNDLESLKSSDPEKKYTMSIMKTKAARYELVGIEDMIPNLWSVTKVDYDKDAFKEGDFVNLHLNDIEDMLLLIVQHKLFHLDGEVIVDLAVALPDLSNRKSLMRVDELYKFSYETLKKVHDTLHHRLHNFRLGYNKDMPRRKWKTTD